MKAALLIIDVQNDFLPGGALGIPQAHEIIPIINELQSQFSMIIATKDWHPINHISFASTHQRNPGDVVDIEGIHQVLWPEHCIQGTCGAEFSPTLKTDKLSKIFYKGVDPLIDSYSAFFDNAHLRSTGLADFLVSFGVQKIYIVGLATEYCVKYSVLDAVKLKFKTYVIIDACRGIELELGNIAQAIEEMKYAGAEILHSFDLLSTTRGQ